MVLFLSFISFFSFSYQCQEQEQSLVAYYCQLLNVALVSIEIKHYYYQYYYYCYYYYQQQE